MGRTKVVVIGAGPAGLTVANLLHRAGIDCLVLERETREFIEQRARAGFIEEWAVRELERHGLADGLLRRAPTQGSFEFRVDGVRHQFDYAELTGHRHFVYPQQELVKDLLTGYPGPIQFSVEDIRLHDLATSPSVTYAGQRVDCDFVAGCDGARGICQSYVPATITRHDYGIGWLALLAEAPPSARSVVFGIHPLGFAGHMARTPSVTRYYLQCSPGDTADDWPDDRVWTQLRTRLAVPGEPIIDGPLIEKRVLPMHNYVLDRMSAGRLHLAGEAAHLVAPIAAKGMNLAIHDALLLTRGIAAWYDGDPSTLDGYSAACLGRVWQYQEFSLWLSDLFHGSRDPFTHQLIQARLRRLLNSRKAAESFAEIYIGQHADF
ncbi:4-hydroxybenzoate 3-monooxygenase [Kibdelosporangium phytohabitans]|uniref:4-hydroxybenzoate 3-monooxygenase n=1 Tax=Kibdelosporangium phytohabitans TaxID=860235 RepID=A0A0N9I9W3_9PSEU|nr:4-hydroxybenzoate 3-monooxygenase [Kibdelosporangium phytohabitans]ALG11259.1 4-hydroxybenzoate 3-monooxygenase [Kibdelosporangium phytohabitans]MBE1462546.1 p-hydroxybenzoate 3-monooxygenase [Kibdelosporangium phytohabitans]